MLEDIYLWSKRIRVVRANPALRDPDSTTSTQPNPNAILAVLLVGTFLAPLDSSIVNIALPSISATLNVAVTDVSWVATAYLLTNAALLLSMGRLGDVWGLRNLYVGGLVVFGLGSAACASTHTLPVLIGARVFQAVGASMLFAAGPAVVMRTFPPNKRGAALGVIALGVSAGLTVGPALGGLLVGTFGWPSIFLINIPLAVVAAFLAWRVLPEEAGVGESFDVLGAVLAGGALLALLLALTQVEPLGFFSVEILGLLVANLVLGLSFIWWEGRSLHPMVDLRLFRHAVFSAGLGAATLAYLALFALTFSLPFFLLRVQGLDARVAGLIMTTTPLAMAVFAPVAGRLADRYGSRWLTTFGLLVLAAGLGAASLLTVKTVPGAIVATLAVVGSGMAIFQTPNSTAVFSATPRSSAGVASALLAEARNMGMALGIAFTAMIVAMHVGSAGIPEGSSMLGPIEAARLVAGMSAAQRFAAVLTLVAATLSWLFHTELRAQVEPRGAGA